MMEHTKKGNANDLIVSANIKKFRRAAKLSKINFAAYLSLSLHQVSKYEAGVNRVTAGRLLDIANLFNVPVQKFFEH